MTGFFCLPPSALILRKIQVHVYLDAISPYMTNTFRIFISALIISLTLCGCSNDENQPDTNSSTDPGTLSMTPDQGTWTHSSVSFSDQGNSVISMKAYSQEGGAMELLGIFFSGTGDYTFASNGVGVWSMSPDTTNGLLQFSSFNSSGTFPSGTFTISAHDVQTNRLSGSFDFYLINFFNSTDSIHLIGSFEDVEIRSASTEVQTMSASIDGTPFTHDYIVTQIVGNTVYLHMVKDIRQRIIVRIERGNLNAQVYNMNQLSLPLGITYTNVFQEYNQPLNGTADVSIHNGGNVNLGIPGTTICTYLVTNGDFGSTDSITISGSFDVEYGF